MSKDSLHERRAHRREHDAEERGTPGKATLTQGLVAQPSSDSASDRARSLIEQLRARATRLEGAIQGRDFDAADSAACVIDRLYSALDRELEQTDDPALQREAELVRGKLDELMPLAPEPRVSYGDDRKRRHAEWHSRVGGGSAPGLPGGLRAKLERTLGGGDLGAVRLHTDAAAQASAAAHDARALTIGQDVYFGAGQFDPDSAHGQHLIAHEVAHTVQQRGGGAASSGDGEAGESEADRFAQAHDVGSTASIGEAVAPSVQCFDAMDVIKVAAGPVGIVLDKTGALDALEEAIKAGSAEALRLVISTGGDLLSVLGRISSSLAKEVIGLLADGSLGIVAAAIRQTKDSRIIKLILDALGSEGVQNLVTILVATTGHEAVRTILRVIADSDLLSVVGDVLFTLPFDALSPILRSIGAPVLRALWRKFRDKLLHWILGLLDEYWPNGYGLLLGANAAATFGYPVRLAGEYEARASRLDDTNVALFRRGELSAGLDTGGSVGGYFGTKSSGVGAQAGVNAEAGMKAILVQEFVFPIFEEPETFLSLVFAFAMLEHSILSFLGEMLQSAIPDPMLYNKRTQLELKQYAQAAAGAEAGMREPGKNTKRNEITTGTSGRDMGERPFHMKVLGLQAAILGQAHAEMGIGCQVTQDWSGVTDRSQGPRSSGLSLFVEAEAGLTLVHSLPLPIPQLPMVGGGMGLRLNFEATPGADGEPAWSYKNMELYAKQGDLDRYNGPAGEVSVEVSKPMLASKKALLEQLENKQFTIRRRFNVATGSGQSWLQKHEMQLHSMLPEKGDKAITVEGFLTVAFVLSGARAKALIKRAIAAARKTDVGELIEDLLTLLSGGVPERLVGDLDGFASALAEHCTEVTFHGRAGIEGGAGAHAAEGAKIAGRFGGKAYFTIDKDLLPMLGELSASDVLAILRDKVADVAPDL